MNYIKFYNVSHTYNEKTVFEKKALKGISFEIEKGKILCICGNTGSGKSTLIKLLNRLLFLQEGTGKILEFDLSDKKIDSRELRKKVGMVFQYPDNQIFESSVKKELIYAPGKFGSSKKESLKNAKKACEIAYFDFKKYKNKNPFELSGGEKRKVAICSILSYSPDIVIFDEPTAGLDNKSKLNLINMIKKIQCMGKQIILISHDMDFITRTGDTILVVSSSEQKYFGTIKDFMINTSYCEMKKYGIEKPFIYRVLEELNLKDEGFLRDKIKEELYV